MIAKIICYFKGHRRGKLFLKGTAARPAVEWNTYECPRCKATWTRKAKA